MLAPTYKRLVGVSACLLGQRVRWDGEHKRADWLDEVPAEIELVPVCPEVEAGLGVPREPIHWVGERLVGRETGLDQTDRLREFATERLAQLPKLSGYILKKKSPSCGLGGIEQRAGLFAAALRARFPGLPTVEEDGVNAGFWQRVRIF